MPYLYRTAAITLTLLGTADLPRAQNVWLVGSSAPFAEIRDAIQVASAGDIIRVGPGTYAHFTDDKGLTIEGASPNSVWIELDPNAIPASCTGICPLFEHTRFEPPAGQESHCTGLRFNPTTAYAGGLVIRHRVSATGRVTFDNCEFFSSDHPALDCMGEVFLLRTDIYVIGSSGAPGLRIFSNSSVQAMQVEVLGGPSSGVAIPPGNGVELYGQSQFYGSDCKLRGGRQGSSPTGAPAIVCYDDSTAWLSDSYIAAGDGPCAVAIANGDIFVARSTVLGNGSPGSQNCASETVQPNLLTIAQPSDLSMGTPFVLDFVTLPGSLVGVLASSGLLRTDALGLLAQPLWLDQPVTAAVLVTDANGDASASWQIPFNPNLIGARLWFQGISGTSLPLASSPVAGGIAR